VFAKVKPNTQIIGQNLVYFTRVDSTNKLAAELFRNNLAENGAVVVSDYQTAGKGQREKEWESNPYENLMFSIGLNSVTYFSHNPFLLNKCITLALCNYMKDILPNTQVKIKWPNDIFVDNRKISGILVENTFIGQQLAYSIIGIGINVNQPFEHYQHINATSIFEKKGYAQDRLEIFEDILEEIDANIIDLMNGETNTINEAFNKNLLGYQTTNSFLINNEEVLAQIIGCDSDGHLILNQNNEQKAYLHGTIKQII
jgi:BirA family transcriptional regulator, biotin operon repressor / biotin---[acetyl-CoA-carboxylase] ligase